MGPQSTEVETPRLAEAKIGNDVGLLLAKLHATGSLLNNKALADYGLRERSFSVLTLACSGLEPTQRELADFLSLDPSQVVSLVDDLEHRGLVKRAQGKQDRRAKIIVSTAEGRRIHNKARAALEVCEQTQLAALSEDENTQLRALLKKALWG
ncbi:MULTISPECIES: MarR family winged helix-turn-helix transcriptional regulator [Paenarthrobacter]|jgi:DNA-binding MarR family transcriptional regulator|uniref:DNA-binding MarR family transcriptional regulator n=2 Tax=Paenarthrobacter TaxID=1742992 RepID=A0ABT9TSM5_PAENI|nr:MULTISPECIES: MarR family winged helix-turn-helix transcriptional regulator [Paenarthrobacter]KIA74462.1 MarR family transcriptional regulator [Arthrobacter sp. MWB30]KQR00927.1 MarR family transcriptional regulator [Arthrobacter sp. Leaf145]SKC05634.1 transcriptional regulator, MarR family [Arthrobacter sp. 31Cvi3.1E]BCW09600.1 transcriptional regulator [Arthrobacter sp. NtRootA2]BCW13680.1 transcriptional regulator [Arthrobacter sp. NtRootA4]BCW22016.1 transcriptional regulator [Arthroba